MSLSTDAFLLPEGPKLDGFPKDIEMGAYEGLLKTLAQAFARIARSRTSGTGWKGARPQERGCAPRGAAHAAAVSRGLLAALPGGC